MASSVGGGFEFMGGPDETIYEFSAPLLDGREGNLEA
jgi:hypothetical protein